MEGAGEKEEVIGREEGAEKGRENGGNEGIFIKINFVECKGTGMAPLCPTLPNRPMHPDTRPAEQTHEPIRVRLSGIKGLPRCLCVRKRKKQGILNLVGRSGFWQATLRSDQNPNFNSVDSYFGLKIKVEPLPFIPLLLLLPLPPPCSPLPSRPFLALLSSSWPSLATKARRYWSRKPHEASLWLMITLYP